MVEHSIGLFIEVPLTHGKGIEGRRYLTQTTRPLEPFKGDIGSLCIRIVFVHLDLIDDTMSSLLVHSFTLEASCLYYSLPHQTS